MEQLIITPEHIRMGGNILDEKALSDYVGIHSEITESTAIINNLEENIFKLTYRPDVATIELISDKSSCVEGDSVNLTATVLDSDNLPLPFVTVEFLLCGESEMGAVRTNSEGIATISYANVPNVNELIFYAWIEDIHSNPVEIEVV